jgi:hypothetical protein
MQFLLVHIVILKSLSRPFFAADTHARYRRLAFPISWYGCNITLQEAALLKFWGRTSNGHTAPILIKNRYESKASADIAINT